MASDSTIDAFPFEKDIILASELIQLFPLTERHYNPLWEIAKEFNGYPYFPKPVFPEHEFAGFFHTALKGRKEYNRYPFIIALNDNTVTCTTSYLNISLRDKRAEIGATWLGEAFRGKKINLHAKFLLLQYIFESEHYQRVEFKTDARNIAAISALKKIGAVEEGRLRSHTSMADGHRRDTVYFSILANEWEKIKTGLLQIL